MDSDEFVARMIAAGVADIEAASTQPPSPKIKAEAIAPGSPKTEAPLIPSAPEDNMGLASDPSQVSLASRPLIGIVQAHCLLVVLCSKEVLLKLLPVHHMTFALHMAALLKSVCKVASPTRMFNLLLYQIAVRCCIPRTHPSVGCIWPFKRLLTPACMQPCRHCPVSKS